jgi:hypothetical protein
LNIFRHACNFATNGIQQTRDGTGADAANMTSGTVRSGGSTSRYLSCLSLYRIEDDGRLRFLRTHEIEAEADLLFWVAMVSIPAASRP